MNTIFTNIKQKAMAMFGFKDKSDDDDKSIEMMGSDEALLRKFNSQIDRELKARKEVFDNYKKWRDAVQIGKQWL